MYRRKTKSGKNWVSMSVAGCFAWGGKR